MDLYFFGRFLCKIADIVIKVYINPKELDVSLDEEMRPNALIEVVLGVLWASSENKVL